MITHKSATLDGVRIAYTDDTVFRVQVGKRGRGYRDRCVVVGDLGHAVMVYNSLNLAAPWQARIYCDSMDKPVLARKVGL